MEFSDEVKLIQEILEWIEEAVEIDSDVMVVKRMRCAKICN